MPGNLQIEVICQNMIFIIQYLSNLLLLFDRLRLFECLFNKKNGMKLSISNLKINSGSKVGFENLRLDFVQVNVQIQFFEQYEDTQGKNLHKFP